METNIAKEKDGKKFNKYNEELITCRICNTHLTTALGTALCDSCWELETRIRSNPELAKKIIMEIELEKYNTARNQGPI